MTEYLPQDAGESSLWAATAIPDPVTQRLQDSLQADVLVVGGGYTGISCALHLAEKGASVVLLEAKCVGFGGSGRNAGLVNAGIWKNPAHVIAELGPEAGQRFNLALRDTPAQVFELVRRFDLDCQASRCGTVNIAYNRSGMKRLRERHDQLRALGSEVELIDGETSRRLSASPRYRYGGILDPGAGTLNPLGYLRSLAKAAMSSGARLYRDSAMLRLVRRNNRWDAATAQGSVSAEQVVLAGNAYSDGNCRQVRESTVPMFIFHCATTPLDPELAASIIPGRHGLWDTQTSMVSSRIDADGRLVMSCPGRLRGLQGPIREGWLRRTRDRLFPQVRGVDWGFAWSGQVGLTSNRILRVQLVAPGLYAPAGYNGRGIGTGTAMGRYLAETLTSGKRDDFPFPIEALYREKWRALRAAGFSLGTLALHAIDRRQ